MPLPMLQPVFYDDGYKAMHTVARFLLSMNVQRSQYVDWSLGSQQSVIHYTVVD